MAAPTDAQILAALPVESRQKINNAFEALSQSMPSEKEQATLYRVAHALKLTPTDTVFSMMAAMHFYLQLYQTIPDKIKEAGKDIRDAGIEVDRAIRQANKETLTDHAEALNAQIGLAVAKNQGDTIIEVGRIAQQIAGDAAAAERYKSFYLAAGVLTAFAMVFFLVGMFLGTHEIGLLSLGALCLGIGVASGMVLCSIILFGKTNKENAPKPWQGPDDEYKAKISKAVGEWNKK